MCLTFCGKLLLKNYDFFAVFFREFSGSMTQMSRMFAGSFMSHQGPDQAALADDSAAANSDNQKEQMPCMAASNVNDTRYFILNILSFLKKTSKTTFTTTSH